VHMAPRAVFDLEYCSFLSENTALVFISRSVYLDGNDTF